MNDSSAACPDAPRCPAAITRPIWRILVFFSNPLFRVSRMSEYSRARVVSLKFFFWCTFLYFLGDFCMRALSCKEIQYCPDNKGFSLLRVIVLQNSFFVRLFSTFPTSAPLFFCANFCKLSFLFAFLRIFRIFSRACIAFINSPIS